VLPVPAGNLFARPEKDRAALQPFPTQPHHFDIPAVTAEDAAAAASPPPAARVARGSRGRVRVAHVGRQTRHTAHSEKSAPSKQTRAEKGTPKAKVRMASLKKHVR
jgi:hypothetical protein